MRSIMNMKKIYASMSPMGGVLRKTGEISTALTRESGIAKSTFLRLLAERGVGTRPHGLTPGKEEEILRLRKQGMIIREISKRVGCSYDVVRIFLLNQKKG